MCQSQVAIVRLCALADPAQTAVVGGLLLVVTLYVIGLAVGFSHD
jgi:hypothetical protein